MAGKREYIKEISQRSLDLGLEGLMIESHCNPSCALSDSAQQLTPPDLKEILFSLLVRDNDTDNLEYRENIDQLRAKIDVLDENLLYTLGSRMKICRQIGQYKKDNNIAILQTSRWDSLLAKAIEKGKEYGLSEKIVTEIFTAVHDSSVALQNEILSGK